MNRVPVAFPQSHTESSSSHFSISPTFHSLSLFSPTLSFLSLSLFSLSDSLALYLSFYLHHFFCCYYPLCLTIPLSRFSPSVTRSQVFREAQQMMHTPSACGRNPMLHRLKLWRKSRGTKKQKQDEVNWKPSGFVIYLQNPTVTPL